MASVNILSRFQTRERSLENRVDVYAYLVIGGSEVLLIDTGVGQGNSHIERRFEPRRTPIEEELARFGLETTDVNLVVNSHLHFDHCGNNRLFKDAEIFVQASELSIARSTGYTVTEWFDYGGARLNTVSGDMEISAGIRLIPTPGHTPGHQSVLVETASGDILIAAQAAYTADEFLRGGDVNQAHEGLEEKYLQSNLQLKSIAAEVVYFSHDDKAVSKASGVVSDYPAYDEAKRCS